MIISLVDQRHTNWSFAQSADGRESSETTTDNDYMRQHQLHPRGLTGVMKSIGLKPNEHLDVESFLNLSFCDYEDQSKQTAFKYS